MLGYATTLKVMNCFFHSWSCFNQLKFYLQQLHEGQLRRVLSACANLFCTTVLENKFWQHSPFRGEFSHDPHTQCTFLPAQIKATHLNQNSLQWVTNHVFFSVSHNRRSPAGHEKIITCINVLRDLKTKDDYVQMYMYIIFMKFISYQANLHVHLLLLT